MDMATDVLVEILLWLPTSSRRRCRLVCRQWRDIIDTRTTEMQSCAKLLIVMTGSVYIVDDLSTESHRQLWTGETDRRESAMRAIVGTCNGLICLCDNRKRGGAIAVVNPVTNETLDLQPPWQTASRPWRMSWHQTYSFAYHPTTGRYKVVHVPCADGKPWKEFHTLQVFTLGEASSSWLGVVMASEEISTYIDAGIVSIDGTIYWATGDANKKVMAFDLDGDRVMPVASLPDNISSGPCQWKLTEVRGRLGINIFGPSSKLEWSKTEVWVLEGLTAEEHRWNCWYNVLIHNPEYTLNWTLKDQYLARPHFIHGEHILTQDVSRGWNGEVVYSVSKHRLSEEDTKDAGCGMVEIDDCRNHGMVVTPVSFGFKFDRRIFSYVETTEPLSVYMPVSETKMDIGSLV